ncbi:MAG: class I SAM-dependent methyltransferase [Pseudomonadota bacterium]
MWKRLSQAVDMGAVSVPESATWLMIDPAEPPLIPELDPNATHTLTRSATRHGTMDRAGFLSHTNDPSQLYDVAVVCLGRARAANKMRIGQAMHWAKPGGLVLVDGQKTDGVESLRRECDEHAPVLDSFSKSHGRLFWMHADPDLFADWRALPATWPEVDGFRTGPGVFSADGIDPGSKYLTQHLPDDLTGPGADLGAGWGYLSKYVLGSAGVAELHLVEDDRIALDAANANVDDSRAHFHWADVTAWIPPEPLDFVVMNPPFHAGRDVDLGLSRDFIATAAQSLKRSGVLWLVANRHLPYEACLDSHFASVKEIAAGQGYKVLRATAPKGRRP